jgi:hypothetical protein
MLAIDLNSSISNPRYDRRKKLEQDQQAMFGQLGVFVSDL